MVSPFSPPRHGVHRLFFYFASRRLESEFFISLQTIENPAILSIACLIPAGAFVVRSNPWTPAGKPFLFPVKAVNVVFRGKLRDLLNKTFARSELLFAGQTPPLADLSPFFGSKRCVGLC
jgi:hypothetical protein